MAKPKIDEVIVNGVHIASKVTDYIEPPKIIQEKLEDFRDMKLGFIPKRYNELISQFLDMGHEDVFEVRVCQIDEEAHPEHQIHINVYIKRKQE